MNTEDKSGPEIALFKKDFTAMIYDLDMRRSSTMPMICNWLQEAGLDHGLMIAERLGTGVSDTVFVLTRLRVRMERYPLWRETVTLETWLSPSDDKYARRNFILHGADGKIIGRAINSAVPFSLKERTTGIFPGDLNLHSIKRENALPHDYVRIPVIEGGHTVMPLKVRYFDCDFFYHVNNVKYIEWCIESLPVEHIRSRMLHEIDINFRAEGNLGDSLTVRTSAIPGESHSFVHAVTDGSGTKDLVRMMSSWR